MSAGGSPKNISKLILSVFLCYVVNVLVILVVISLLLFEHSLHDMLYDSLCLLNLFYVNPLRLVNLCKNFFRCHAKIWLNSLYALFQELLDN